MIKESWKKILSVLLVLLVIFVSFAFFSCDEDEGKIYFGVDWIYTPDWFLSNVTNLPSTINNYTWYETSAGSYYFTYYHSVSGYERTAYFTLTNASEGDDAYYDLFLYAYSDPSFSSSDGAPRSSNFIENSAEKTMAEAEGYVAPDTINSK